VHCIVLNNIIILREQQYTKQDGCTMNNGSVVTRHRDIYK